MAKRKLKTETCTPAMGQRIRDAFMVAKPFASGDDFTVEFEHGQWWVCMLESGHNFSVVDATGGNSVDGFDFEEV